MAKQVSHMIKGSDGNLVFYIMDGKGYVRRKSSLTGKQFKSLACFEGSRISASRFAKGNSIASEIYKALPPTERNYPLFCTLKSKAISLLKEGMPADEIKTVLLTPVL